MPTFVAHYRSPNAAADRAKGLFEFESSARMGTKALAHDARVRMLEIFGTDALAWTIDKVEKKKAAAAYQDGQLELDFRDPKPEQTRKRKTTKRGLV